MLSRNEAVEYLDTLRAQSDPAGGKKFMVGVTDFGPVIGVTVTDSGGSYAATGPTLEAAVTNLLKDDASWPQK